MTNQELRTTITISNKLQKGDEREVTEAILRLLEEHARMKDALEYYADGEHSEDHAREILKSLKGNES